MSEETKVEELDLIEDVTEVELQDDNLEETVEVENEESIAEDAEVEEVAEEVVAEEAIEEAAAPKTKAGIINAMYSEMSKMKKADLQAAYESMMGKDDEDGDDDDDEEVEETKGKVKESYDFEADLDALVSSDDSLSE